MSGSNNGADGDEQGGEPQEGQPRGNPPQGGQPQNQPPQGNQPQQGGQPRGQPPQGGQPQGQPPQGGQARGQPQGGHPQRTQPAQSSGIDQELQDWTIFTSILFSLAGAGVGLLFILENAIDEPVLGIDSSASLGEGLGGLAAGFGQIIVFMFPVVVITIAPFIGAAIAMQTDHSDQMVFKLTAAGLGIGTLIYFFLSTLLYSTTLDGASIEFGGLLINAALAGLAAAGVGVGGNWTARNQAP